MSKRICILGSGLVSSSVVNFFCRNPDSNERYAVTLGSIVENELKALEAIYPSIKTVLLDVTVDEEKLAQIITTSDIVISLLNNEMHVPIAKLCINLKVHMVHASYCTKEMMELDEEAKKNGVIILNELGLDPGIDHLLAMKMIDEIREDKDSKITAFISYCGGLPEPALSNCNPLRYKFSWSPITSLRNLLNPARFIKDHEVVEISEGGSLIDAIEPSFDDFQDDMIQLEAYPNRDSLTYKDLYGIQEAKTIIRGTYRYRGFKEVIQALFKLGLFSQESTKLFQEKGAIQSWGDLIANLINHKGASSSLLDSLLHRGFTKDQVDKLDELGLLSNENPVTLQDTLLETLANYLTDKLKYECMERDMVIMLHEICFEKQSSDGDKIFEGKREIRFVAYGEQDKNGFSAMAKTVGLTIGHATKLLLKGSIKRRGVIYPFTPDIYNPVLEQLKNEGIVFVEKQA